MTKISIIIPTYNSERTLTATIESILMQSFTDYEVLLVDGLSTDKTLGIIEELGRKDNRIKWISEKDEGIYDAMNKGIVSSVGEWLYFLGSDDTLHDKNVLLDLENILNNHRIDIFYGDAILKSSQKRYGGTFDIMRLLTVYNLCHQTIFYRKSVFEKVGNYNLDYKIWADWDLNIRCFRHTNLNIEYVDRLIVTYNDISGISSLQNDAALLNQLPIPYMDKLEKLKEEHELILNSSAYKIGKKVYEILRMTGIVSIYRTLSKK